MNTMKKNTGALLDASKEVGLEVNTENTKCMFMFCDLTPDQNPRDTSSWHSA
jgi:hypothetical protein